MFKEVVYLGALIPKPNKVTVVTKLDDDGFRYKIGDSNSKKVLYEDLNVAILELNKSKEINRKWFNNTFGNKAKSNPCNYTTIGGVLINMKLAYYDKGSYRAI